MRITRLLAACAATLLVAVPQAHAHEGNPSFRSEIEAIRPAVEGLDVQVLNFDDSLRLTNRSGETVVITGYDEEPYVKLGADGTVEVNRRSPAYYLNDDRYAEGPEPDEADPQAAPEWERVDGSSSYSWHDHRIHWMSRTVPPQVEDESERTKIFDYEIPITVGGRPGSIAGTLVWVGEESGFPLAPFAALAVFAAGAAGAVIVIRRRRAAAPLADDESGGW